MACFLVPTAEALVMTVVEKAEASKEKKAPAAEKAQKIPFSRKLKWLTNLLWGGAFLLAFEHVWHGEVVPFFPFLTAASNAEDAAEMLHEMATAGVGMAVAVTVVWAGMLVASAIIEKRAAKADEAKGEA
ncbi:MAG: hypothetical protein J5849_00775 [Clostridia bacterium]|nr:hypothetical protein [Clostridia bacterium]MBR5742839.1 hypothetical protein [Clostridia bacterium]